MPNLAEALKVGGGSVGLSRCIAARPLYTRLTHRLGGSACEPRDAAGPQDNPKLTALDLRGCEVDDAAVEVPARAPPPSPAMPVVR